MGSASGEGIISISSTFDSLGGMGKTVKDVALLTDVLLDPEPRTAFPSQGLSEVFVDNWEGIKVGFVDASCWQLPPGLLISDDEYKCQMVSSDSFMVLMYEFSNVSPISKRKRLLKMLL